MSCQGLFPIFSKHGQKNIHHTRNCGFHSLEFPHTQFHAGFICNFLSSSAGFNLCSCFFPAHRFLLLSFPTFSGPSIPRLIAASFSLSDPRCFSFLSSASVLDSDYLASVSSFPLSSRFCLTMLSPVLGSPLGFPSFPFLRSGFPCRFPVIGTWLSVCFLSPFPASLPQLLVRCSFRFSASRFFGPIRILASASVSFPVTQPSASSVPFSSDPRLTAAWTLLSSPLGSLSSPSASILSYWVSGYRYLAF